MDSYLCAPPPTEQYFKLRVHGMPKLGGEVVIPGSLVQCTHNKDYDNKERAKKGVVTPKGVYMQPAVHNQIIPLLLRLLLLSLTGKEEAPLLLNNVKDSACPAGLPWWLSCICRVCTVSWVQVPPEAEKRAVVRRSGLPLPCLYD